MISDDESNEPAKEAFAARWARRKREARAEPAQPALAPPTAAALSRDALPDAAEPSAPLPTLEDVTADGDIAAFLQKRIPAELHKLALRKAWSLDPTISTFIEMAENQYDWNTPGGAPGYGPLDPSWNVEALLTQATGLAPGSRPDPALAHIDPAGCDKTPQEMAELCDPTADQMLDAAHNDKPTDDQRADGGALSASSERLMHGEIAAVDDHENIDMLKQTQRLAAHQTQPVTRRAHGGALPEID
jgi:hypothetical protein